jgi:hypothetical protein
MTDRYDEWERTSYQPESGVGAHNPKQEVQPDAAHEVTAPDFWLGSLLCRLIGHRIFSQSDFAFGMCYHHYVCHRCGATWTKWMGL